LAGGPAFDVAVARHNQAAVDVMPVIGRHWERWARPSCRARCCLGLLAPPGPFFFAPSLSLSKHSPLHVEPRSIDADPLLGLACHRPAGHLNRARPVQAEICISASTPRQSPNISAYRPRRERIVRSRKAAFHAGCGFGVARREPNCGRGGRGFDSRQPPLSKLLEMGGLGLRWRLNRVPIPLLIRQKVSDGAGLGFRSTISNASLR